MKIIIILLARAAAIAQETFETFYNAFNLHPTYLQHFQIVKPLSKGVDTLLLYHPTRYHNHTI